MTQPSVTRSKTPTRATSQDGPRSGSLVVRHFCSLIARMTRIVYAALVGLSTTPPVRSSLVRESSIILDADSESTQSSFSIGEALMAMTLAGPQADLHDQFSNVGALSEPAGKGNTN